MYVARGQIATILGCEVQRLDRDLDALAARARSGALKLRITPEIRDRARNGRYAFVHDRGHDFAAGIWVVDAAFMLDLVHEQINDAGIDPAREEAYCAGARLDDDDLRDAAAEDEQRGAQGRVRRAEAIRSNVGLGQDIRAGLIQPTDAQLHALREIVCRLLVLHHGQLIAYGTGWTDPDRQRPVGDTGRHEPAHADVIIDVELDDPDPLRGIAQLTARWAAALMLDPAGVTRTKALGSERMARTIHVALPGGEQALRAAIWEFMRPMLSPALVALTEMRSSSMRAAKPRSTSPATEEYQASRSSTSTRSIPTPREPDRHVHPSRPSRQRLGREDAACGRPFSCARGSIQHLR